jgi:hypothetical protein
MLNLFYSGVFMKAKTIMAIALDYMMNVDLKSVCIAFRRITAREKSKPSDKYLLFVVV